MKASAPALRGRIHLGALEGWELSTVPLFSARLATRGAAAKRQVANTLGECANFGTGSRKLTRVEAIWGPWRAELAESQA